MCLNASVPRTLSPAGVCPNAKPTNNTISVSFMSRPLILYLEIFNSISVCLMLPDHRDAGDQEPDGGREIGDDGGTPSARIVEAQVVDGAEVHCRNARDTEGRPHISNPARPSG